MMDVFKSTVTEITQIKLNGNKQGGGLFEWDVYGSTTSGWQESNSLN